VTEIYVIHFISLSDVYNRIIPFSPEVAQEKKRQDFVRSMDAIIHTILLVEHGSNFFFFFFFFFLKKRQTFTSGACKSNLVLINVSQNAIDCPAIR
jgi:hypothetical protein